MGAASWDSGVLIAGRYDVAQIRAAPLRIGLASRRCDLVMKRHEGAVLSHAFHESGQVAGVKYFP
jgi:hypothetical protein